MIELILFIPVEIGLNVCAVKNEYWARVNIPWYGNCAFMEAHCYDSFCSSFRMENVDEVWEYPDGLQFFYWNPQNKWCNWKNNRKMNFCLTLIPTRILKSYSSLKRNVWDISCVIITNVLKSRENLPSLHRISLKLLDSCDVKDNTKSWLSLVLLLNSEPVN